MKQLHAIGFVVAGLAVTVVAARAQRRRLAAAESALDRAFAALMSGA